MKKCWQQQNEKLGMALLATVGKIFTCSFSKSKMQNPEKRRYMCMQAFIGLFGGTWSLNNRVLTLQKCTSAGDTTHVALWMKNLECFFCYSTSK